MTDSTSIAKSKSRAAHDAPMILGLITPASVACTSNAGAHLITHGIRHLLRRAIPDARFVPIDLLRDDARQWAAAEACDALILCGNPRFSTSEDAWWEAGIWERLEQIAETRGTPIVDAWGGSCLPLPALGEPSPQGEAALQRLLDDMPRMARVAPAMRRALAHGGAIARDRTALACYQAIGVSAELLPCSSWWAADDLGVEIESWAQDNRQNTIVLLGLPQHDWAPAGLRSVAERMAKACPRGLPTVTLATNVQDWQWARANDLPNLRLVTDPASVLREYARSNRVVSLRIHASIPAASLGAEVCTLALDTRAEILEPFGLPWQRFDTTLQNNMPLQGAFATLPDPLPAVRLLRALLNAAIQPRA